MNLLLFSEYFPESENSEITGGVEARCFNIAKNISKKNKVTVITSWRPGLKRQSNFLGMKVVRVGPEHKYTNRGGFVSRMLFVMYAISEGLKHKDASIISGENWTTYYPAFLVAKKIKRPCVITYHETWIGEWIKNKGIFTGLPYEIYERILLTLKYDKIVSVSLFTKDRLVKRGVDEKKIEVIYNGINLEDFQFNSKKETTPTICFIGRLVKTKKVDVLLKAVSIIKERIPNLMCKIVGKGEEKEKLEKLVERLGIKENTRFYGFIKDTEEVRKILKSSTVFCLPSTVEGFGIVVIESMASGTPYLCSDIDVLRESTGNGKGGFLFKKDDPVDLAKNLFILLKHKKTRSGKIVEGKLFVKKYQWKSLSEDVEKTYKQVIEDYKFR